MKKEKSKVLYIILTVMFMCIALGIGTAIIGAKLAYTDLDTVATLTNLLESGEMKVENDNLVLTREGVNRLCDFVMEKMNDLHNTAALIIRFCSIVMFICIVSALFIIYFDIRRKKD